MKLRRIGAAVACVLVFSLAQASAARADALDSVVEGVEVAFDLAVLRPLNLAAVAVGAGFFLITAPLVAPFEEPATAFEIFVYAPYEYTFLRDLGDI